MTHLMLKRILPKSFLIYPTTYTIKCDSFPRMVNLFYSLVNNLNKNPTKTP